MGSGVEDFDCAFHTPHSARRVEDLDGESVAGGGLLIIGGERNVYAEGKKEEDADGKDEKAEKTEKGEKKK